MDYLPDYSPGLGQWARQMLTRFDEHLLSQKPEVAELVAAGVAPSKVEILYPLDLSDYAERTRILLTNSPLGRQMLSDEFSTARPENALWEAIPAALRPDFQTPRKSNDDSIGFSTERLLMTVGGLSTLQRWPFHAEAQQLGFNGRTFAENKMQRLASNLESVNASLERVLRIIKIAPVETLHP